MGCLLAWIEAHPGTAAWAQAVGSVVAIIASALTAFLIARSGHRAEQDRVKSERQTRKSQCESEAVALAGDCAAFLNHVRNATRAMGPNDVMLDDILRRTAWLRQQDIDEETWAKFGVLRQMVLDAAELARNYSGDGFSFVINAEKKVAQHCADAAQIYEHLLSKRRPSE